MTTSDEPAPWERLPGETARAYASFRTFRDLGPTRGLDRLDVSHQTAKNWSSRWDWHRRAEAWDAEQYRVEDAERLEAIRTMHATHQRVARAAIRKAIESLNETPASHIPPGAAVRLLDVGTRLERQTLIHSVEELQGVEEEERDDPWQRIADELIGAAHDERSGA